MKKIILLLFCILLLAEHTFGQSGSKFFLNLANKNFNSNLTVDKDNSIQRYTKGQENTFMSFENDKVTLLIFEDNTNNINSIDESKLMLSRSSQTISFGKNTLINEEMTSSNLLMIPKGTYALTKGTYNTGLQSKNVVSVTISLKKIPYNFLMPFHYTCASTKVANLLLPNDFVLSPLFTASDNSQKKIATPEGVKMEIVGNYPYLSEDGILDLSLMPSQELNEQGVTINYRFEGSNIVHNLKIKHFRVNEAEDLPSVNCRQFGMVAKTIGPAIPEQGNGGNTNGGGEGVIVASKPKSGPKGPKVGNGPAKPSTSVIKN